MPQDNQTRCMGWALHADRRCRMEGTEREDGWIGCGHHRQRTEPDALKLTELDGQVLAHIDQDAGQDAKSLVEATGLTVSQVRGALNRLLAAELVEVHDSHPQRWVAVGTPTDAKIEISARDAWLVCHLLRKLVRDGTCGEPTAQALARIEAAMDSP